MNRVAARQLKVLEACDRAIAERDRRLAAEAALVDVCAGCGQTLLMTPDDPMPSLWCDTCEGGVK